MFTDRGNIDSLPDDQIKRLTEYVGFMLEAIERGENGFPDGRQGDGSQGDSSQGDSAIETEKETDNQTGNCIYSTVMSILFTIKCINFAVILNCFFCLLNKNVIAQLD